MDQASDIPKRIFRFSEPRPAALPFCAIEVAPPEGYVSGEL
jgi:hypothetical protein